MSIGSIIYSKYQKYKKSLLVFLIFLQINPFMYWKKREYKKTIRNLREFARDKILNRLRDIENNEYAPDDILTAIVKSCGKIYFSIFFILEKN